MENTHTAYINQLIIEKSKYLTPSDTRSLYTLSQNRSEIELIGLSSVKTYNPTLITVLYWLLPFFWLFNRSFTLQYTSAIVQFTMALIVFPGLQIFQKLGWMAQSINDSTPKDQVFFQMGWYGVLGILVLWFFIDGFTIHHRIKKGNYQRLRNAL